MKKWVLIAIAICSVSTTYANTPERTAPLAAKVILQSKEGYFGLSDGSCWKTIGFSKRWRSLSEWWNNVRIVPENYECVPNDWVVGAQVDAYPKYGNLMINEADASNQEALKQCTHLLVNSRTGQVLFAIPVHPADCLVQVFKEGREEGYSSGLTQGRLDSYNNAHDIYDSGHAAGYKVGYAEGYQASMQN